MLRFCVHCTSCVRKNITLYSTVQCTLLSIQSLLCTLYTTRKILYNILKVYTKVHTVRLYVHSCVLCTVSQSTVHYYTRIELLELKELICP